MKDFDKTLQEAIDCFSREEFKQGTEAVKELAHQMKSAGTGLQPFLDLMTYVEESAVKKAEPPNEALFKINIRDALRDGLGVKRASVIQLPVKD